MIRSIDGTIYFYKNNPLTLIDIIKANVSGKNFYLLITITRPIIMKGETKEFKP